MCIGMTHGREQGQVAGQSFGLTSSCMVQEIRMACIIFTMYVYVHHLDIEKGIHDVWPSLPKRAMKMRRKKRGLCGMLIVCYR